MTKQNKLKRLLQKIFLPFPSSTFIGPMISNNPFIEEYPGPPCSHIISGVSDRFEAAGKNQKKRLELYSSFTVIKPE